MKKANSAKKPTKRTVTRETPKPNSLQAMADDMKRRVVLQHDPVSLDILTTHGLAPTPAEAAKILGN